MLCSVKRQKTCEAFVYTCLTYSTSKGTPICVALFFREEEESAKKSHAFPVH
jgi:hypothetical protein